MGDVVLRHILGNAEWRTSNKMHESPVMHEGIQKGHTTFVDGIPPDNKAHSAALTSPWSSVASARWPCLYKSCSLRIIRGKKLAIPVMTPCAPTASAPLG